MKNHVHLKPGTARPAWALSLFAGLACALLLACGGGGEDQVGEVDGVDDVDDVDDVDEVEEVAEVEEVDEVADDDADDTIPVEVAEVADDAIPVDVADDADDTDDEQETDAVDEEPELLVEPQTVVVPATVHEPARVADAGLRTPAAGRGMPATVYRVLLVAPSDVAYERSVAEKAISHWNSEHTEEFGIALVARRWLVGEDARLWEQADLLVGVFSGMPGMRKTDASSSSTAHAVEEYVKSERGALLYFSACAAKVTDESEGRRLRELRQACERRELATEFSSPVHLKELLTDDLTTQVQRLRGAALAA